MPKAIATLRFIHYDRDDSYAHGGTTVGWIYARGEVRFEGVALPESELKFDGNWYDIGTDVEYDDEVRYSPELETLLPVKYHRQIVTALSRALWSEANETIGDYPDELWLARHGFKQDPNPEYHEGKEYYWEGERVLEIELK